MRCEFFFETISTINDIVYNYLLRITYFVEIFAIYNKTNFKNLKTISQKIVKFALIFFEYFYLMFVQFSNVCRAKHFECFISINLHKNLFQNLFLSRDLLNFATK